VAFLASILALSNVAVAPVDPTLPRGRVVVSEVACPGLDGNLLGDPSRRRVHVYLPAAFDREPSRRFPSVYLLHSWGGRPEDWLGGEDGYEGLDVASVLDRLVADGSAPPMLVVMPDASNRLRGSWYRRSGTTGDWEGCLADSLVREVESRFRARVSPAARGIVGQSMGGYGALHLALRRPEVFGSVLAMSVPCIRDPNRPGDAGVRAALAVEEAPSLDGAPLLGVLTLSKAAAFAPDPGRPPFFGGLPASGRGEALAPDPEAIARWQAATVLAEAREDVAVLRRLRLRLEVGERDPLVADHRAFSAWLTDHEVRHEIEVFDGDHSDGIRRRFETSVFAFFARAFTAAPRGAWEEAR
jgi:pimeloyl-ACP methyl ester carboxylesterase